jgi:SNF2 family DNA or RNA helicase
MSKPFTPREYQTISAHHIMDTTRCAVFIPVGGGKCASTLMALEALSLVEDTYPVLIIAPKRVARDTWRDEIAKWSEFNHIIISPIIGTPKERFAALQKKAMIYTINPEGIEWLIETLGEKWPFKVIVFDESSRLRGYRTRQGTKRTAALATRAHTHTKRFVELTGTPSPKGLENLWGQLYFLDKGERLGKSFSAFEQRWFRKGYDGFSIQALPHAEREIHAKISDICVSIDLSRYFDVKEPIENTVFVELPDDARKVYDDMEKQFYMELKENSVEAFNAASKSSKLLQITNGAAYVDKDTRKWEKIHDAKIEALESIVEESDGMPILVAYNFVSDRDRLLKHFGKASVDLATTDGFKTFMKGNATIGLAHPASMGHGVDGLQNVTNIMVHFGLGWDLELHDQIQGRIGPTRQLQAGFDRNVFIHYILARGTIDELVLERLTSKRKVQDILMDALRVRERFDLLQ